LHTEGFKAKFGIVVEMTTSAAHSAMDSKDEANRIAQIQTSFPNVKVVRATPFLTSLFSTVRDRDTPRAEFVVAADTLLKFVCENAISLLPHEPKVNVYKE